MELIKLYIAIGAVFFLPGYFFGKFLFNKKWDDIATIEKLLFIFVLSLAIVDFGMILLNYLSIQLNAVLLYIFLISFAVIFHFLGKRKKESKITEKSSRSLFNLTYRQYLFFFLLLIFAISIRSLYVSRGIMPQTTDLGHHMYWSKTISETGQLPVYGMPDFIIGEHLVFAAIQILSGISYISAFPVIVILIINIFSLIAVMLLAYETSSNFLKNETSIKIALLTFFVAGCLYAIGDPQAKFVSGGVIGNIIGNFLLPTAFYFFIKTIRTKNSVFAFLFILTLSALAYTHHLSSFILLYCFFGFIVTFLIFLALVLQKPRKILRTVWKNVSLFLKPLPLVMLGIFLVFLFVIHAPSYLNPEAIDTAVGTPIKDTRIGLAPGIIIENAGPWRFFYGIFGIIFLGINFWRILTSKKEASEDYKKEKLLASIASIALLLSWGAMLLFMSYKPSIFKIDIPSNRIVSYITYPFIILSSIGIVALLAKSKQVLSGFMYTNVFLLIFGVGVVSGMSDISESARDAEGGNELEVNQTYTASKYLASVVNEDDIVLKDHIYLSGDTWMKLFFMKGYKYPLSRSYLRRYEDIAKDRETCTRDMVAIPDKEIGRDCFTQTGVTYIVLKKNYDTTQFQKSENFEKVYSSDSVVIYHRLEQTK